MVVMKRFMMSTSDEQYQYLEKMAKDRQVETVQEAIRQLISEDKLRNQK